MNVLHVVRRLDAASGGAPAAAVHMAAALATEGHDITMAATLAPGDTGSGAGQLVGILADGTRIEQFPRTRLPYDHSFRLARWLRQNLASFDLVEVHGVFDYPCWRAAELARRAGMPLVVHPHGSLDPFDLRKHRKVKALIGPLAIRRILDAASAVVVTTDREGASLHTFGASPRVHALPLPYLPSVSVGDASKFGQSFELADEPILLFLGRVDYKKGLQHVVDAAAILAGEGVGFTAVIAGDASSDYASNLKRQVVERRLQRVVRFVGHLDEQGKADALAAASALALVSDNENYGLVLVEATRAGIPLLVSDKVYLAEDLVRLGGARVVERRGIALAEAFSDILADEQLRGSLRAGSTRAAVELFDWGRAARRHSDLRKSLLGDLAIRESA